MEIIEILRKHAKKYPLMQPCDAVKLIFQNEFGGGHLIKDPEKSLEMLRREFSEVEKEPGAELYEYIGNGISRVNLSAIYESAYPLEALNRDFVSSAENRKGSLDSFLNKLSAVSSEFEKIGFGFEKAEFEAYICEYKAAGCPMVSHSEIYRKAYKPAYRVVEKKP